MSNIKKTAPLKVANPNEVNQDWSIIMQKLPMLADWIKRTFAVDISGILENELIIIQPDEPTGQDRSKFWIKTSSPPGIGIPFSGDYSVIYQYTPGVPFVWTQGEASLPTFLRKLSETEVTDFGLSDSLGQNYFYVIFEL